MNIQSGIMRFDATKFLLGSDSRNYFPGQCLNSAPRARHHKYPGHLTLRYRSNSLLSVGLASERRCTRLHDMSNTCRRSRLQRFYCSKTDGQDGEHKESTTESNAQAPPGEQDQTESKNRKSPLSTRGAKFRDEFVRRIVPWEEIPVSLDTLPYYIHDRTKNLLVECMASHLKQKEFRKYGGRLACSSNRILLQSIPGTRLYRERLVSALAREFQVPLLKLDSSILPPYNFSEDYNEGETDEESSGSVLDLFADDTTDEEEDTCSNEETTDDSDEEVDNQTTDCASIGSANSSSSSKSDVCLLKEGDRVEYVGPTIAIKEANNRILSSGQRGEVHEVNGDEVAVIFNICGMGKKEAEKDDKNTETAAPATLTWFNVKDIVHDCDAQTHDCHIAMEVLYEVLESHQPIVAYFPDSFCLLSRRASYRTREEFVRRVKKIFAQFSGRVVLICAQDEWNAGSEVMEKLPVSLKQYIKRLKTRPAYEEDHICRPFTNVIYIKPPKDQDQLNTFIKQLEEDRTTVISEGNLSEMHKVLKEHGLSCMDLKRANSNDVILTRGKAEKVVSWATNHYLSSCPLPCVEEDRLHMSHESIKLAISRLKEQETEFKKPIKDLASGRYERRLVSAVVSPSDIGVKFDDVGALEDVKKVLYELVILPMRRPELFSHGNLLRPCKGMLLFGPPGNGKTLLAKALATEAGANFINITTSSITSMWLGESEKLTRALFSYASKLAPVIIFVDEADSLLGARGRNKYDDARLNEFMAAWDGLRSKESQRILVLGATNRPFDMDDAVIRRMPRRIYVGLPDVENRSKILQVLLAKENLEPGFSFEQLAEATEGYSGSDLKNLCVAAAYRPVQELLEEESKGKRTDGVPAIRPLNLDDLIHSKAKVAPSVAHNTSSMNELSKWNEQFGEGGSRRK